MHAYMAGSVSDWLASDAYPIQGERRPMAMHTNDGYTSTPWASP